MELTLDQALQKGIEAHKAGDIEDADRYYTAILKANPDHPDANHNMGVLAVGVGQVQEALPFFKKAVEVNSSIEQFWLSYIDALITLDRIDDAKAVYQQAESAGAKGDSFSEIEKRLGLGSTSTVGKNVNISNPPKDQLQHLVNLYNKAQYQETLEEATRLQSEFPASVTLYNIVGAANNGLGRLDEAIEAYTSAVSINPQFADAYYNMGNVLKDQGKLGEAVEAYNKAISINPDYPEAYNNTGLALQDQGKLEDAIEAYNKALKINPEYAEA